MFKTSNLSIMAISVYDENVICRFLKMTLFGVSYFTLSWFPNQWTDFYNFCIILMRIQISMLITALQKSQNGRKYPWDSGGRVTLYIFSNEYLLQLSVNLTQYWNTHCEQYHTSQLQLLCINVIIQYTFYYYTCTDTDTHMFHTYTRMHRYTRTHIH